MQPSLVSLAKQGVPYAWARPIAHSVLPKCKPEFSQVWASATPSAWLFLFSCASKANRNPWLSGSIVRSYAVHMFWVPTVCQALLRSGGGSWVRHDPCRPFGWMCMQRPFITLWQHNEVQARDPRWSEGSGRLPGGSSIWNGAWRRHLLREGTSHAQGHWRWPHWGSCVVWGGGGAGQPEKSKGPRQVIGSK